MKKLSSEEELISLFEKELTKEAKAIHPLQEVKDLIMEAAFILNYLSKYEEYDELSQIAEDL